MQETPSPTKTQPAGQSDAAGQAGSASELKAIQTQTKVLVDDFKELAKEYGPPAVGVLVILAVAWVLASWARRATRRALIRARFDPTLGTFLSNALRWLILILAVLACMNLFGIQTTSFAAIIGAAGLAIGLALQGSLSNLAAGIMLLIFRPFKVGDWIIAAGQAGKVCEIDLFQTSLDTSDGRRIIVPNGPIFTGVIENSTFHPKRRIDLPVSVQRQHGIDQTRQALLRAVKNVPGVLTDPAPQAYPTAFVVGGVDWVISVWAQTSDLTAVRADLIQAIKGELDKAEIQLK